MPELFSCTLDIGNPDLVADHAPPSTEQTEQYKLSYSLSTANGQHSTSKIIIDIYILTLIYHGGCYEEYSY